MPAPRLLIAPALVLLCLGLRAAAAEPADEKSPIPDAAARAKALAEIKSVLADDYAKLGQDALAKKLLELGNGSQGDIVRRYVMFLEAAKAAIVAGDVATMFEAVDAMALHYTDIDPVAMKAKGLENTAKVAPKDQWDALAEQINDFTPKLVEQDRYETAQQLLDAALTMARRQKNTNLMAQIRARQKEIGELAKEYADASAALKRLKQEATDPEANLAAGKYFALTKGDWDKGVPMLALGSDADLKAAATLDLAQPTEAVKQVALADKWWDLAAKARGSAKGQLQSRAAHWYQEALPSIEDALMKTKVEKRLAESQKAAPHSVATAAKPLSVEGEYRLATTVTKSADRSAYPVGQVRSHQLFLHLGGKVECVFVENNQTFSDFGHWQLKDKEIAISYASPKMGQATLKATKRGRNIVLDGTRSNSAGVEWSWKATQVPPATTDKTAQALAGVYQLSTRVTAGVAGFQLGHVDNKDRVVLSKEGAVEYRHSDGTTYPAKWVYANNVLLITFEDTNLGQVTLTVKKSGNNILLEGSRRLPNGIMMEWRATK